MTCSHCGASIPSGWILCDACLALAQAARGQAQDNDFDELRAAGYRSLWLSPYTGQTYRSMLPPCYGWRRGEHGR